MPTLPLHTHVGDPLILAVYFCSQTSWSFVAGEEPGIFPRFWTPFCLSGNWFSIAHTHLINILHEGEEVCSWLGASWAHETGMKTWNRTCDKHWNLVLCKKSVSKILIPLNWRLCYVKNEIFYFIWSVTCVSILWVKALAETLAFRREHWPSGGNIGPQAGTLALRWEHWALRREHGASGNFLPRQRNSLNSLLTGHSSVVIATDIWHVLDISCSPNAIIDCFFFVCVCVWHHHLWGYNRYQVRRVGVQGNSSLYGNLDQPL